MTFGQSKEEAAQQKITPDFLKSDADKAKENVEGGVRDITGNAQPHDTFRQGSGSVTNALKPSGQQSFTEKAQQETDKIGSHVQPNESKTLPQQARDFSTPGNDSAGAGGIVHQAGESISNAAHGVKNALVGGEHGKTS
ncbi:hypothetical protein CI109_103240 [Kwoniella shandongensis]|uniref:Uncharacterized protein n=1 Tax=Kwoniella shandongensis TaxID=1734106 RepID=A0A5M6BS73_9TREE|nr:uncharacterized protein CI109_006088 [Kwoniella shandongensis]KAA5525637.1 hypothetical protein CI109_006088 [Kwoniella shandongensis]